MFDIYCLIQPLFVRRGRASFVVQVSGYHRNRDSASSWGKVDESVDIGETKMSQFLDYV